MTHPSIQGLREAVGSPPCLLHHDGNRCDPNGSGLVDPRCYEAAQAAYLTEHGVLLSGEGLVRAEKVVIGRHSFDYVDLVRIPEDGS